MKLQPRPLFAKSSLQCPQILAYQIVDQADPIAMTVPQKRCNECYCPGTKVLPQESGNTSSSAIAAGSPWRS